MQRQVVDYALRRRSLLAEVYSGRTGVTEVCDANPYLLRAAKFHGKASAVVCPICRKPLPELAEHFPFCSERCRMADLGAWAAEKYVVKGEQCSEQADSAPTKIETEH